MVGVRSLVKTRAFWARIGVAVAVTLVGTVLKGMTDRPTLPRDSTNLRRVDWSGTLAEDGSLAVEVRYEFLAEALKNDPDRPRAELTTADGAVRTRVNGRPAPTGPFNRVAPTANDDLTTTVAYEVPDAAQRVGDQILLDVSAVSPLHWLYNNYGSAEVHGVLLLEAGDTAPGKVAADHIRIPGAREVRAERDGQRLSFSGRVSTYDEAGIVALLPLADAPDAPDLVGADGRRAGELFDRAADKRSADRIPDGVPDPEGGPPWLLIGLGTGVLALTAAGAWHLKSRARP